MSSSKKISSKEREILNRQRALAAARRQQSSAASAASSSSSLAPVPSSRDINSSINTNRPRSSTSTKLNHRGVVSRLVNPYTNNTNNTNNTSTNKTPSKKRKLNSSSSNNGNEVIDLTNSPSSKKPPSKPPSVPPPPLSSSSSTTQQKRPSAPPTKRPTVRKNIHARPSMVNNTSHVQKAISASRSRIQHDTNNNNNDDDTSLPSTTFTSTKKKSGLSSLLSKAGITSKQLSQSTNQITSSSTSYADSLYKRRRKGSNGGGDHDDDDDDGTDNFLNMNGYFDHILSWDFLHDLNNEKMSTHSNQKKKEQKQHQQQSNTKEREQIPDIFTSRKQYQKLWSPLCLDEAQAQILSDALTDVPKWNGSTNSNTSTANKNNNNRRFINNNNGGICLIPILALPNIKDIGTKQQSISIVIQKDHNSNFNYNSDKGGSSICSFMANDLIVLAKDKSIFIQSSKGKLYQNSNSNKDKVKGCIGVVEYGRKSIDNLPIKVSRKFWLQLTTGKKEEKMIMLKLGLNVTNMREYSALCRIGSLPLLPYLLCKKMTKAKDSLDTLSEMLCGGDGGDSSSGNGRSRGGSGSGSNSALIKNMGGVAELGEGFTKYAQKKFNSSQLGAISAAATEYGQGGFTLVKGPPGKCVYIQYKYQTSIDILRSFFFFNFACFCFVGCFDSILLHAHQRYW